MMANFVQKRQVLVIRNGLDSLFSQDASGCKGHFDQKHLAVWDEADVKIISQVGGHNPFFKEFSLEGRL